MILTGHGRCKIDRHVSEAAEKPAQLALYDQLQGVLTRDKHLPDTLLRSQIHDEDCIEEVACHAGQAAGEAGHQQVCHALAEPSVPLPVLNSKPCHVLGMCASPVLPSAVAMLLFELF